MDAQKTPQVLQVLQLLGTNRHQLTLIHSFHNCSTNSAPLVILVLVENEYSPSKIHSLDIWKINGLQLGELCKWRKRLRYKQLPYYENFTKIIITILHAIYFDIKFMGISCISKRVCCERIAHCTNWNVNGF